MKTYMSGFAIDEEAADAEVPSDEEVPIPNDYKPLHTERQRRPVSAMRAVNYNVETELIDGELETDGNQDLRDISPDRIEVRSRGNSKRRDNPEKKYRLRSSASMANLKQE